MAYDKRHPYLTKEFWEKNQFWETPLHGNKEQYRKMHKRIMDSFNKTSKE